MCSVEDGTIVSVTRASEWVRWATFEVDDGQRFVIGDDCVLEVLEAT